MKKWKCMLCGYIHEGETPPDECPLCGASSDQFEELIEEESPESTEEVKEAEEQVEEKDPEVVEVPTGPVKKWRCTLCGYIHEGPEPPDECPICGADSDAFEEVVEEEKTAAAEETAAVKKSSKTWRCKICGYIHEGDAPPEKCPLCGAAADQFEEVVVGAGDGEYIVKGKKKKEGKESFLVSQIMKHHIHPIIVHTPNGVLPVGLVFVVLAILFNQHPSFDTVAFYNNIFVLITMPAVLATGIVAWKKRYNGAFTPLFKVKIAASALVTMLLAGLVIWRVIEPDVLTREGKWTYLILSGCMIGAVGLAGHMGGKLVFGGRE